MTSMRSEQTRQAERGNVLFLILIAVALFAALSYAVTQSTRSGSGDASGETNLINSAQLAQYPSGVRTSIVRMIIGGVSVDQLFFNPPSQFDDISAGGETFAVFHPQGGGAVFQLAPNEVMVSGNQAQWVFTADYAIEDVGSDPADVGTPGNDVIAFLPRVSQNVCRRINEELGIDTTGAPSDGIPASGVTTAPDGTNRMITPGHVGINTTADAAHTIGGAFQGQPFGCFNMAAGGGGPYIYYHVLVER